MTRPVRCKTAGLVILNHLKRIRIAGDVSPALQSRAAFSAAPSAGTPRNAPYFVSAAVRVNIFNTLLLESIVLCTT